MVPQFVLLALATLISEDLTCIAAGVLIAQGKLGFTAGVLACLLGIVIGDVLLFLTGRFVGRTALRWAPVARFLPPERVARASAWLEQRGLVVVFLSRFTPGLRLSTYFAAGLLSTRFWSFAGYFVLASGIWTPLLVGSSVVFGDGILKSVFAHRQEGILAFVAAFAVVILLYRALRAVLSFQGRRRLIGFLKRKLRWEFWPAWAAYVPLLPYFVYLAIRHRSLTLFTATNPGIPTGGFVGESKSQILSQLGDAVADYIVIREPYPARLDLDYPVVLKPDVGERGSGVAVVRSKREFDDYVAHASGDIIIQRYVPGVEFGVFYYRYPGETRGRIFSITEKRFPEVVGDGFRTVGDLILRDPRAVCMAGVYRVPAATVPAAGERVRLVESGSHCRGAIFLDGIQWNTPALEEAIERISQAHPGFYFGRFDVRAASVEAFQRGDFRVIELNGVAAEATHIYDPAVSLLDAYRAMFTQWRIAFEIGAMNRARGFAPMPLRDLLRICVHRRSSAVSNALQHPVSANVAAMR